MIRLDNISKQHGHQILFIDSSMGIQKGEKAGLVDRETLLALVEQTPVSAEVKERIRRYIEGDFASSGEE